MLGLGVVGLDFLLRLHTLKRIVTLCLFYLECWIVKYVGDTWFVVCITCKYIIELWLVFWRDQYIYLLYQMERKKKIPYSLSWRLGFSCFGPFWVWGVTTHIGDWFPSWTWIWQGAKFSRLILFLLLLWLIKD